ncbi:hypothetical protein ZWY2020_012671 [Hordeum vulgare]|nr:hypothetical protein ZWY2020_012671 [Hordeum vulgare]
MPEPTKPLSPHPSRDLCFGSALPAIVISTLVHLLSPPPQPTPSPRFSVIIDASSTGLFVRTRIYEEARWAAPRSCPPTIMQTVLAMPEGELKEVNADKVGAQQRIASVGDDHECFLSKFKDRVDRSTTATIAQPAKFESIPECFCL